MLKEKKGDFFSNINVVQKPKNNSWQSFKVDLNCSVDKEDEQQIEFQEQEADSMEAKIFLQDSNEMIDSNILRKMKKEIVKITY